MTKTTNSTPFIALIALLNLVLQAGCAGTTAPETKTAPLSVTVMSFNVENLFDNENDPGKDDKAYLPIAAKLEESHIAACNQIEVDRWRDECLFLDWSDAALEFKLRALATTIRQVGNGLGPDIIALQEIENLGVLERLRTEHLASSGYLPAVLIEGNDARGIDVAFLSRLPLLRPPTLHPLVLTDFPDRAADTRGVLQADFVLPDGSTLTGFSVHFPAPFHPTAMRADAYGHLTQLLLSLPDNHHAFAAGDFNTTSREDREMMMLDTWARPFWIVAHDLGCRACKGTQYYARDDSWSFLDMILFREARGGNTTAQIRADSVRIANRNPAQVAPNRTPERFDWAGKKGVSDHWPMVAAIEFDQKQ